MRPTVVAFVWLAVVASQALAAPVPEGAAFYVAPDGSDGGAGMRAAPFATLERARDEIRKLKAAGPLPEPVNVFVRGGIYELPQALKLGAEEYIEKPLEALKLLRQISNVFKRQKNPS